MSNLPKLQDLYADKRQAKEFDKLVAYLNQAPAVEWVKKHPFIKGYNYLPIERVEYLLRSIFKSYRIEITGQGTAFNGVWVTVRVHYIHPVTSTWEFHDGIGACQLQTAKGTSPADLANINNGAIAIAFPIAKTLAIKDSCDHFGKLFGSDLNRKDDIAYGIDLQLYDFNPSHPNWNKAVEAVKQGKATVEQVAGKYKMSEQDFATFQTLTQ
jgi:hypothetical protein